MKGLNMRKELFALCVALASGMLVGQDKGSLGYIGSQACQACHAAEHSSWQSSGHAAKSPTGPEWAKSCERCHTTSVNAAGLAGENHVGCEACHGPARDHAAGGDKSKIAVKRAADVCGQCHSGQDEHAHDNEIVIDAGKLPPESGGRHSRTYRMWKASGHSNALNRMVDNNPVAPECYGCHSDEGFKAKQKGKKIDLAGKESFNPVTCVTCHDPHGNEYSHQLRVEESEELCSSCHSQRAVLQGKGAKGLEEMRSFHSAVDCVSCHMSEENHLMKVIRPDDPALSEKRVDTCSACHRDNNRKARARQVGEWQTSYDQGMPPLQADLKEIDAVLKERPASLNDGMKAKLKDVRANLSMLESDKSRGAHNVDLAAGVMEAAARDLKEIKTAIR